MPARSLPHPCTRSDAVPAPRSASPARGAAAAPIRVNAERLTSRALCTLCAQEINIKDCAGNTNFGLTRELDKRRLVFIDVANFLYSGFVDTKVLKSYLCTVMTRWANRGPQCEQLGQPST